MFENRETIIDDEDDFHIINSPSMECPNQELISVELDDTNIKKEDVCCSCEILFWKYARCILYLNIWLSPFRLCMYTLVGLVYFLCCDFGKAKLAAMEMLKSTLVIFAAAAAIYVTQDIVVISNCIGEVIFEFVVGGLTLQILLGLGDAFVHGLFGCSTIDCNAHKLVESIVEPIVFIGGLFSIFTYFKSAKRTKEARYAKYAGIGNLIGSTIVIVLAIFFCFKIEENANKAAELAAVRQAEEHAFHVELHEIRNNMTRNWNELIKMQNDLNIELGLNETEELHEFTNFEDDFKESVVQLYDKKNAILATNVLARIFSEGIAKFVEHKFVNGRIIAGQATIT